MSPDPLKIECNPKPFCVVGAVPCVTEKENRNEGPDQN